MLADGQMASAVQQSHATVAPSMAEAAAMLQLVPRLLSPRAAQAAVTSASSAAVSVDNLPTKALLTSHVGPQMSAAASGVSAAESAPERTAAAESASKPTAAESASQPAAVESVPRHALDKSAFEPGACAMGKPQSTAAGVMAEANRGWSARAGLVQTDMPLTKALVQSSGTGCEDILEMSQTVSRVRQRDSWVSRSFRGKVQSSCTLQLQSQAQHGVSIKVLSFSPLLAIVLLSFQRIVCFKIVIIPTYTTPTTTNE